MNVNKPISRRKALKVMGLGMLAACVPTLPSFGESPKENEKKTKRLIFYFSATGNSLYIARQLGGDEATLLSISQEIHNEHPDYEAEEIGFVCPVYCFIPPAIVQDFIARSSFKADYFFTVGTYGAHSTIFPEFVDDRYLPAVFRHGKGIGRPQASAYSRKSCHSSCFYQQSRKLYSGGYRAGQDDM